MVARIPRRWATRQRIRRAVLDAARALLAEVGPRGFTVKEVARRAGVGRTTVYKYFGMKAELLAVCREDSVRRRNPRRLHWSAQLVRARSRGVRGFGESVGLTAGLERVRQGVLALAEHAQEESDLFLLAAAEEHRAWRTPRGRRMGQMNLFPRRLFSGVEALVKDAVRTGEIRRDLEPEAVVTWLAALWWQKLSVRGPRSDENREPMEAFAGELVKFLGALCPVRRLQGRVV